MDEVMLQHELRAGGGGDCLPQRCATPGDVYFKHALIQDAAYQSFLKSTRQQYHQRIAQVWKPNSRRPLRRARTAGASLHGGGPTEQAIAYWQRAGQHASDRSAYLEAISHFTTGIELLETLPETPERAQQALTLHIALGTALQNAKGHAAPEVEHAYTQARALCQQVGETPQLVPVLFGLWRFYVTRYSCRRRGRLAETLLRLAQQADDPALRLSPTLPSGRRTCGLGALPMARLHIEEASPITRQRSAVCRCSAWADPGVACRSLYRDDPLVAGVPGASPGPPPRGPGAGARAGASL